MAVGTAALYFRGFRFISFENDALSQLRVSLVIILLSLKKIVDP